MNKISNDDANLFSVKNKVIAIIGATGILGEQYVDFLSGKGAKIIMGDIDYDKCKNLSKKLNSIGRTTFPLFVDNASQPSIENFFNEIVKEFKSLDVLINNAQVKPKRFYSPFEDYDMDTLNEVLCGNLSGVVISSKEACKIFQQNGSGVIVNIGSIYGVVAPDQRIYSNTENIYFPGEKFSSPVSYAISKAGIVQLTKYLSSYYREKSIRVNCLTPGGVFDSHDVDFVNQYSKRTTLGRMAEKNEYNGAILFLCSEASAYMNGANLIIDGGISSI
tara:strand:- start:2560 stop:3387 length:828 start_codon:yes stop_codon:yes gene_type:complete